MAVSVDTVYQKVLAIANKEQRGYITPQEFNLFASKAQMDIFESYFGESRASEKEVKLDAEYGNKDQMIEEKLITFKYHLYHLTKVGFAANPTGNEFYLPDNLHVLGNVYTTVRENSTKYSPLLVKQVDVSDLNYIHTNNLLKPVKSRPVYVRTPNNSENNSGSISMYPSKMAPGWAGGTRGNVFIDYIRKPAPAKWGYVVVGGKALYNAAGAFDFELHASEEGSLVNRILELSGISTNKPGLSEVALRNQQINEAAKNQ